MPPVKSVQTMFEKAQKTEKKNLIIGDAEVVQKRKPKKDLPKKQQKIEDSFDSSDPEPPKPKPPVLRQIGKLKQRDEEESLERAMQQKWREDVNVPSLNSGGNKSQMGQIVSSFGSMFWGGGGQRK